MRRMLVLAAAALSVYIVSPQLVHAAAASAPAASAAQKSEDQVVARVNGTPIMRSALTPVVEKAMRKYRKFIIQGGDEDPRVRVEREELDKLIGRELLYQAGMKVPGIEAKAADWVKADAENAAAQALKKEQQKKSALEARKAKEGKEGKEGKEVKPETVAEEPKKYPVEDEALRAAKKRTFIIDEYLFAKGALTPVISDDEAKKYYDEHQGSFTRPETVKASHILVKIEKGATEKDVEAARKKAEEAGATLKSGKKFEDLAKEISACASAAKGGDLGVLKRGFMPKEFDAVAFKSAAGEVSAPVRTEHGFHLIKVVEVLPAGVRPFAEVKEFIKGYLSQGARDKKYQEAVIELKKTAVIEKSI